MTVRKASLSSFKRIKIANSAVLYQNSASKEHSIYVWPDLINWINVVTDSVKETC